MAGNTPDCNDCPQRNTNAFCILKTDEVPELNDNKTYRNYRKGQHIFLEGDRVNGLHCIKTGNIKIFKTRSDGGLQILKISKPGELIGYRGMLGNGHYIGTAEALESAEVCFVPKSIVLKLISENLDFSLLLMSMLAGDIDMAEEKSVRLIQRNSKEKLAETLLDLEKRFGKDENGSINIHLTRQELGAIAGLAPETIIRLLHEWEKEGILELNRKLISITNRHQLINITNTVA